MQNQGTAEANGRAFKVDGFRICQEPHEARVCACKEEYPAGHLLVRGELEITVSLVHGSQSHRGDDLFAATLHIFADEYGKEKDASGDHLVIRRNFHTLSSVRFWLCNLEPHIIGLLFHNLQGHFQDRNIVRVLLGLADQTKEFDKLVEKEAQARRELFDTFRSAVAERC